MSPHKGRERLTVGYVRVSTDEQARDGVSLDAQQERIRAYALATGRELAEVIVDAGESAKTAATARYSANPGRHPVGGDRRSRRPEARPPHAFRP